MKEICDKCHEALPPQNDSDHCICPECGEVNIY